MPAAVLQKAWFAGHVITGFSLSVTVTLKLQVLVLLQASVAVTCTEVVPTLKKLPEAGLYVSVTEPQLSEAIAAKDTLAPQAPVVLVTLIGVGQVISGALLSFTVMVCVWEL